jgi:hypothetical protein
MPTRPSRAASAFARLHSGVGSTRSTRRPQASQALGELLRVQLAAAERAHEPQAARDGGQGLGRQDAVEQRPQGAIVVVLVAEPGRGQEEAHAEKDTPGALRIFTGRTSVVYGRRPA